MNSSPKLIFPQSFFVNSGFNKTSSMRKISYCLLLLLLGGGLSVSAQTLVTVNINQPPQLSADAGVDDVICPGDSIALGGSPSFGGGTPPVTYAWSPSGSLSDPNAGAPVAGPAVSTTYSLTVTDANNCTALDTISIVVDTCVGLTPASGMAGFYVFPNPNDGNFNLSVDFVKNYRQADIQILDVSGKMVWEKSLENPSGTIREEVNLKGLGAGIYFIKVHADTETLSRKIIIQ